MVVDPPTGYLPHCYVRFLISPIFARWPPPASHTLRDEYLVGVVKFAVIPPFPSSYE